MGPLDHIALGTPDLDERIAFFTGTMGMTLKRMGVHHATGGRIAMLADPSGFKIELIEAPPDKATLWHVAYRVDDVDAEYRRLVASGCQAVREPHDLPAARARTALMRDPFGLQIQIIAYAPDSPDL